MYAVVTTGGKQYRVEAGSELLIERLTADAGSSITFDRVLLVGDGDAVTIGTPTIDGASVSATVLGEALGPKLQVFKFKQKVKYRRMAGHRQHLLRVRIDEISAAGRRSKASAAEGPAEAPSAATDDKPKRAARGSAAKTQGDVAAQAAESRAKPTRARATAATAKVGDATEGGADAADTAATPKRTRKPAAKKPAAKKAAAGEDSAKAEE